MPKRQWRENLIESSTPRRGRIGESRGETWPNTTNPHPTRIVRCQDDGQASKPARHFVRRTPTSRPRVLLGVGIVENERLALKTPAGHSNPRKPNQIAPRAR